MKMLKAIGCRVKRRLPKAWRDHSDDRVSEGSVGFYARTEEILASADHSDHAIAWRSDRSFPGFCSCPIHLYVILIFL